MASGNASEIGFTSDTSFDSSARRKTSDDFCESDHYGPPFTIQRQAEVRKVVYRNTLNRMVCKRITRDFLLYL